MLWNRSKKLLPMALIASLLLRVVTSFRNVFELVRRGGRVAYPNGIEPEPHKRSSFKLIAYDAEAGRREFEKLDRATNEARLRVPIAKVYPLTQAAKAHARLQQGHLLGRIVLQIRRDQTKKEVTNEHPD